MSLPTAHSGRALVTSFTPVTLEAPGRPVDLTLRVSAPHAGETLPIILLSHGHGPSNFVSSHYGYAPLAEYYASHGFAVVQPTHLDSAALGLRGSEHPEAPLYWRSRAEDMTFILDHLQDIEVVAPPLAGRLDRSRIGVVGHSMGGHTASVLLGATFRDPLLGGIVDLREPRIRTGVVIAGPGRGEQLSPAAAERMPVLATTDFSDMRTPALIVRGDADDLTHLTTAGPAWLQDPYLLSPAPKADLIVFGGEHGLGGIAGYDLAETTDENPERVEFVRRLTATYLRSQLYAGERAWQTAMDELSVTPAPLGRIRSR